jgi:gamma-glutamyltranspeptidase / glutathione hydrolase
MLRRSAGALAGAFFVPQIVKGATRPESPDGYVVGEPAVESVGAKILADGGNAFDALVATALAGAVTQLHQTGIGGYASHGIFSLDGGRRIIALDANSTAPAAMREDIFKPDSNGKVPGLINEHGWLATGVPGVIAGLKLVLDKFGTRSFSDVLQPAIRLTREGFRVSAPFSSIIGKAAARLQKDIGSRKLYLPDGRPPAVGTVFRNPELAALLETLAKANSVEPFYRGDIAQRIAEGFQKNGGLVTAKDLAAYQARLVEPISLKWDDHVIYTAPLTSGGLSVLQMLAMLRAMGWEKMPAGSERTHAQVEAMRLAWRDRLTLLGDPDFVKVPQARLLSEEYARECADKVHAAVKAGTILPHDVTPREQGGTLSFSAVDRHGNLAALTLTHGNAFGAGVTVDGLGLTLGHGMSRFDPHPDHPNAPGPGKRPFHNMVPTLITRGGLPLAAVGGRGGRRIPNSMLEFLIQFVALGKPFGAAMDAPRIHTEGDATVEFEKSWPASESSALAKPGYRAKTGGAATLSAVMLDGGTMRAAMR